MGKRYTVVYFSEDGDVSVDIMSEEVLLGRLKEGHWGKDVQFLDGSEDTQSQSGIMILAGGPVIPKAIQTVTEFVIE